MKPPTTSHPSPYEHEPPPNSGPAPSAGGAPLPLTDAEQRERVACIERNLWQAFIGLLLFALSLWGA